MKITKKYQSRNPKPIFLSPASKRKIKSRTITYKSEEDNKLNCAPNLMKTYSKKLRKEKVNVLFSFKNYDKLLKNKYINEQNTRYFLNKDTESKISIPTSTTLRPNRSVTRPKIEFSNHKKNNTNPLFSEYAIVDWRSKLNLTKHKSSKYVKNILKNTKFYSTRKKSVIIDKNKFEKNKIISSIFEQKTKHFYKLKKKIDDNNDIIIHHLKQSNILKNNEDFNVYKIIPRTLKIEDFELFLKDLKKPEDIIESQDIVTFDKCNDDILKHKIRKTLAYEINEFNVDRKYVDYYKSIPNYINFVQDIFIIPHIQNHFVFKKFKALDELTELLKLLTDKNFFNRDVTSALNKTLINMKIKTDNFDRNKEKNDKILNLLKKQGVSVVLFYKKIKKEEEEKLKIPNLTDSEKEELTDYFSKQVTQQYTDITNDKLKNIVYYNEFFKINRVKKRKGSGK